MAIFKHTYSGLITKGLGMPACCGMITLGFHLFKCRIEVSTSNGGGYAITPVYVAQAPAYTPLHNKMYIPGQRVVMITVSSGKSVWRKAYTIDSKRANIVVKVLNYSNSVKRRMKQLGESLKVTFRRK